MKAYTERGSVKVFGHGENVFVSRAGKKGRGVFSEYKIREGEIIEIAPVLTFTKEDHEWISETKLGNYVFDWGKGGCALALGCGSLYNHDINPNAEYCLYANKIMQVIARRNIVPGEEITINYNGNPDDDTVWSFENGRHEVEDYEEDDDDVHLTEYDFLGEVDMAWCGVLSDNNEDPKKVTCEDCLKKMGKVKAQLSKFRVKRQVKARSTSKVSK